MDLDPATLESSTSQFSLLCYLVDDEMQDRGNSDLYDISSKCLVKLNNKAFFLTELKYICYLQPLLHLIWTQTMHLVKVALVQRLVNVSQFYKHLNTFVPDVAIFLVDKHQIFLAYLCSLPHHCLLEHLTKSSVFQQNFRSIDKLNWFVQKEHLKVAF